MESVDDRNGNVNQGEEPAEDKAAEQTPGTSRTVKPRMGLRERTQGRPRSGVCASSAEVNGAAPSPQSSGRVLRDRSTRAVPAWLKDTKSEDEDQPSPDSGATKRRRISNSGRKRNPVPACSVEAVEGQPSDNLQGADSDELQKSSKDAQALPSRRSTAHTRANPPSGKTSRSSAKATCKTEPGVDNPAAEEEVNDEEKDEMGNTEKESEDVAESVLENEDPEIQDDANDPNLQPQTLSSAEEDESLSTDEELPFRDDLNDESYDPKVERDAPKPKRRVSSRQKDKKEKERAPKKEKEVAEIKIEVLDNVANVEDEVKLEEENVEDRDGPRKRGRKKKDDKTPRLPKRRKKPPVQYVRCEMEGCGTVLAHPRYLQHHIKYQHLLKKKYVCPHPSCGRLFRLQKQLLRHAKHHTDQRDYICEFCARAFKSSHNLAVHRMIHTGEKPLQCEICGFTCRQKASLNWHMKKHDADATYQFSCSICGKKFEKKDCVVAHKAKSHPEVLIAEALAANAGALITTPTSLLEQQGKPAQTEVTSLTASEAGKEGQVDTLSHEGQAGQQVAQVSQLSQATQQMSHQLVLLGQDQNLHTMQVPVTIALTPVNPPSLTDSQQQTRLQLQMPVQFVQAAQQPQIQQLTLQPQMQPQLQPQLQSYPPQHQGQGQTQILQMTFQPVSQSQTHVQHIPVLATSPQIQTTAVSPTLLSTSQPLTHRNPSTNGGGFILDTPGLMSSSLVSNSLQQTAMAGEEGKGWDETGHEVVSQH